MSKAKARVFVPLNKVDEEQRLVYGTITQEVLDKSGEVMDYESSKPHFQKWSDEVHAASGGLSKGNLRVMHGLSVAGKLTDLAFNDEDKSIEVCAKVVDDAEWNKVLEGCYTGFSVGGKYEKRWTENGVKKYTAGPNEVSLVDNPCVGTATFALVKADGATEERMFKSVDSPTEEAPAEAAPQEPAAEQQQLPLEPTNDQVVAKAEQMAKDANDGSTWMTHVEAARDALVKAAQEGNTETTDAPAPDGETKDNDEEGASADADTAAEPVEKVTPPGVKQVWAASDGKTFEKKADCEAHEATLIKSTPEPTEAEKLKARLEKALTPPTPEEKTELLEDFDRLGKAINALSTPFGDDGQPVLEKGMYTINRFSNVLSDMASLSRSIKSEGQREGDDASDSTVAAEIISAVKTLGASFITYATEQVQELLAGMDDDVVVTYYDYYYNAAKEDGENELAKDVCSLVSEFREPSRERRETLGKAFGMTDEQAPVETDELSPALAKRFAEIEADRDSFKKVAETAVEQVEELAKRVKQIEDTPLPRAPVHVIPLAGETFFGKTVHTDEDRMGVLKEMLDTHGPDGLATMMIKAAQATGGQRLHLKS